MTINKLGDTITIYGTLLVSGTPTDPNTLRLEIEDPAGSVTEYIWGQDPEIVQDSTGQFHFNLMLTQPGAWLYRWYSNSTLTAFEDGEVVASTSVNLNTVDDADTPNAVPFVTLRMHDADGNELDLGSTRSDASGVLATALPEGTYRLTAYKLGWIYDSLNFDVVGNTTVEVQVPGRLMTTNWLRWEDLERTIDKAQIDRLFNDDNSGVRDMVLIEQVIEAAEALAESKLLRSWTRDQVFKVAREDAALRSQAAWLALEMATERRQEFIASDGKGRFWAQYERAISYFDALSKSKDHSRGEAVAKSANTGGARRPEVKTNENPWTFAEDGRGHGQGGF